MRFVVCALLLAACAPAVAEPDESTTGAPPVELECLYDGDCGEDARCHAGACVMQCEGLECCMLAGDCDPPGPCGEAPDCPTGYVCHAGTCDPRPDACPPPAVNPDGSIHG
jgi:hypothetical protein